MRQLSSLSGAWRVYALWAISEFKMPTKTRGKDYWMQTPSGRFHCPDLASAYQFWPRWEREVKGVVMSLRDSLFVDVGANIGFFSVLASRKNNHVIALEPNASAFRCLKDNMDANSVKGKAYHWAAWDSWEELSLTTGRYTDTTRVVKGEGVQGAPLDDVLNCEEPALVKMDAEGSEPRILQGMLKTLRCKPKIVFEALNNEKLMECARILHPFAYTIDRLDRTNYLAQ